MQPHRLAILVIAATVAACAEPPFIEAKGSNLVDKPDDRMRTTGQFTVCHGDGDFGVAEQIARQRCASYGFQSQLVWEGRYQCRASAPHQAMFRCYHPDLTAENGDFINPFDPAAIEEWRKRTGKVPPASPVPGWETGETVIVPGLPSPTAEAPGAPPPAALGPAVVGPIPSTPGPADIPGWPVPEIKPPPPLPPSLEAPGGGFSLPMGSWGQAFEE